MLFVTYTPMERPFFEWFYENKATPRERLLPGGTDRRLLLRGTV